MHNASGPALGRRSVIYLEFHTVCMSPVFWFSLWLSFWLPCVKAEQELSEMSYQMDEMSSRLEEADGLTSAQVCVTSLPSPVYHHQSTSHSPNTLWGSTATGARRTTDTQTDRQKDIIIAQSPLPDTLKCIMAAGID